MDVEKARQILSCIGSKAAIGADPAWTEHQIDDALRALDGEGGEEVWHESEVTSYGHCIRDHRNYVVCHTRNREYAQRIVRLPALERAADELLAALADETDRTIYGRDDPRSRVHRARIALRAALDQEGR